ncbi:MAG: hypothetical protein EOM68_10345 [Spirochaetia bacterium]|nr:hypothetical protein [Spirochaetia bacterium]
MAGKRVLLGYDVVETVLLLALLLLALVLLFPVLDALKILIFLLVVLSLLVRWRFRPNPSWMLIDASFLVVISLFVGDAGVLLGVYVWYFATENRPLFALLYGSVSFFLLELALFQFPLLCLVLGLLLSRWRAERHVLQGEADALRLHLHRLEEEQVHLLLDYQDAQQLSRLEERSHIAQILHDSLGHELTGAHLSGKMVRSLLERGEVDRARESQDKVIDRLERSLGHLKMAVRDLESDPEVEKSRLEALLKEFSYPVETQIRGDLLLVPASVRQLLHTCLTEALTNVAKHAKPSSVVLQIDSSQTMVRMMLENDGLIREDERADGNGLRYMRRRVEAVGGSLSIQRAATFRLIVVIPLTGGY